jgi:uncharacterized membrane protein YtjA (UPF0391 family)
MEPRQAAGLAAIEASLVPRRRWNRFPRWKLVSDHQIGLPRLRRRVTGDWAMTILKWALIFFLVSVVAGILGFTGLSAASADIARFLFYVFVVIFLVLLILGLTILRV